MLSILHFGINLLALALALLVLSLLACIHLNRHMRHFIALAEIPVSRTKIIVRKRSFRWITISPRCFSESSTSAGG